MDLEKLKKDFSHKAEVDVKDINVAIKAVPFLVKEVMKLEEEVSSRDRLIERLKKKLKKQPPTVQKGKKDNFFWVIKVDEDANTILFQFGGIPNKSGTKICSNTIINMAGNLERGFSVISDYRKLEPGKMDQRMLFYFRKVHYLFMRMRVRFIIRVVAEELKDKADDVEMPFPVSDKLKIFTVTSIEEGKEIIKNLWKPLRK